MTAWRKRMRAEGRCIDCGQPAARHAICCLKHLLYRAQRAKRYYTPRKKAA